MRKYRELRQKLRGALAKVTPKNADDANTHGMQTRKVHKHTGSMPPKLCPRFQERCRCAGRQDFPRTEASCRSNAGNGGECCCVGANDLANKVESKDIEAKMQSKEAAEVGGEPERKDVKFVGAVEKCKLGMLFQVCEGTNALAAVSKMDEKGNRVVFEHGGGYVEHIATRRRVKMRKKGDAYVIDVVLSNGQKEEITIDSGAEESVCPWLWGEELGMKEATAKISLVNASGKPITHYGSRDIDIVMEAEVL